MNESVLIILYTISALFQQYYLEVKAAGTYGWQPYHLFMSIVVKSGSLNLLEPSESGQACKGIALPLPYYLGYVIAWIKGT
jgi:hypothetical protein